MSLSIAQTVALANEYEAFLQAYNTAGSALSNVISTGTVLYNDANLVVQFPTTSTAYKSYLLSLQTAITTFLASLPSAPVLNG